MLVIGELINSTRDEIKEKIAERDKEFIQDVALKQEKAGADFIDVNAGAFVEEEIDHLLWLVEVVQDVVEKPLALDSPSAEALKAAAEKHEGKPMINSITLEEERYADVLPIVKEFDAKVVALCMSDDGMPDNAEDRINYGKKLVDKLIEDGVPAENIFVDPIINPISVDGSVGLQILEAIETLANYNEDIHITCGLSNISFGLPHRSLLNQAFIVMGISRGMDSAIIDPLDEHMMKLVKAAEVLTDQDQHAMNYLKASRAGELD